MKKLVLLYGTFLAIFLIIVIYYFKPSQLDSWSDVDKSLKGESGEQYVMVTFQAGIDYWKPVLKGFEDAAEVLHVSVDYRGSTQYDVHEQMTVLEQVIARKPAGIALTAMEPTALTASINKAVDAGIPVVLFDSGAEESKAYSFLGTNNYNAGVTAAHEFAKLLNEEGRVAVITLPNQLNHQERVQGFQDTIRHAYPMMRVVAIKDGKGDVVVSREMANQVMEDYSDLGGIFVTEAVGGVGVGEAVVNQGKRGQVQIISFDTDKGTLDMIQDGVISATLAQGTWNMGYWSLQFLFHIHHDLVQPNASAGGNQRLLPPDVDTGVTVVTRANVIDYYAK
jgi:ribose transport system substrate-binding protein